MSKTGMQHAMKSRAVAIAFAACMATAMPGLASSAAQAGQATTRDKPTAAKPAAAITATSPATMTASPAPEPVVTGTGDAWVDAQLADIDLYAARYPDAFIDEIARYQGTPRALVVELVKTPGWKPGDVYYACAVSHVIGRPCRAVAEQWTRDRATGWQAVATAVGVEPGSDLAKRVRATLVESYARWERPAAKAPSQSAPRPSAAEAAATKGPPRR